jgi:tRNA (guanine37-N1)-methyltransferase
VLSSGETAALIVIDAVYRLLEGVINNESLKEESHSGGLLEYPHYTRPELFQGRRVPEVLLSGNHELIRKWRLEQSLRKTWRIRPDLLKDKALSKEEQNMLNSFVVQEE